MKATFRLGRLAWLALLPAFLPGARAAELPLRDGLYNYTVLDQDLRVALREFGANNGLRVTMSDAVQGRIRGRLPPMPAREFLERLVSLYGLDWYFDGRALHLTAASEAVTRILRPAPGASLAEVEGRLRALGIHDARFPIRATPDATLAVVAGPPRYVELVEQAVTAMAPAAEPPAAEATAPGAPAEASRAAAAGITIMRGQEVRRVLLDGAGRLAP